MSEIDARNVDLDRFVTRDRTTLKAVDGSVLSKWFGLKSRTEIRLREDADKDRLEDPAGWYQFAIIARDGAVMRVQDVTQQGSQMTLLINDDGLHPTKLACAHEAIYFDKNTRLSVEVDSFHGREDRVALTLIWRQVHAPKAKPMCSTGDGDHDGDDSDLDDDLCGRSGNHLFFGPSCSKEPNPGWLELVRHGWHEVRNGNYFLPPGEGSNPCNCSVEKGN
jgi:hypothetical protein